MKNNLAGNSGHYVRGFTKERIIRTLKNRFYSRVNIPSENDCMEWCGVSVNNGYGQISVGKRMINAHRVSYIIHFGDIKNNLHVLHTCDNRRCVLPEHLYLGTNKDNINDKVKRNRVYRPKPESFSGKNNPNVKLNRESVAEIKTLLRKGEKKITIAKRFNITPENILFIQKGITWGDVK